MTLELEILISLLPILFICLMLYFTYLWFKARNEMKNDPLADYWKKMEGKDPW